jgi:hypothetical protein
MEKEISYERTYELNFGWQHFKKTKKITWRTLQSQKMSVKQLINRIKNINSYLPLMQQKRLHYWSHN